MVGFLSVPSKPAKVFEIASGCTTAKLVHYFQKLLGKHLG
jgi:hypothetical protein